MFIYRTTYPNITYYYGPVASANFNGNWYQGSSSGTQVSYPSNTSTATLFVTQNGTLTANAGLNAMYATTSNIVVTGGLYSLQFSGTNPFVGVGSGYTLEYTGAITSGSTLTKNGAGTLKLSGGNTITSSLNLEAGVLSINNAGAVGAPNLVLGTSDSSTVTGGSNSPYVEVKGAAVLSLTTNKPNSVYIKQNITFSGSALTFPSILYFLSGSTTMTTNANLITNSGNYQSDTTLVKQGAYGLTFSSGSLPPKIELRAGTISFNTSSNFSADIYGGALTYTGSIAAAAISANVYGSFNTSGTINFSGDISIYNSCTLTPVSGGATLYCNNLNLIGTSTILTRGNGSLNLYINGSSSGYKFIVGAGSGTIYCKNNLGFSNIDAGGSITYYNNLSTNTTLEIPATISTTAASLYLTLASGSVNQGWKLSGNITSNGGSIVATTSPVEISGTCSGTTGFTDLSGTGVYTISGTTSFPTLRLTGANVKITNQNALSSATGSVTLNGGASVTTTLDNISGSILNISSSGILTIASNLIFTGSNNLTVGYVSNTLSINPKITVNASIFEMSTPIIGVYYISKYGTGTLKLSGASSSWTGSTYTVYLYDGTILLGSASALGTGAVSVSIGGTTVPSIDTTSNLNFANNRIYMNTSWNFTGTNSGASFLGITMGGSYKLSIYNFRTVTVSGIAGAGVLELDAGGTLTCTGANTSTSGGYKITWGILKLSATTGYKYAMTIMGSGTLDMSGLSAPSTTSSLSSLTVADAAGSITTSKIIFKLSGTGATTLAVSGNINISSLRIELTGTPNGSTTFNLITYTGTATGTPTLLTTTLNGHTVTINSTAGIIRVTTGA